MADKDILEIYLAFSTHQNNVTEQASKLLSHFGTLANVFDAPYESLSKVSGITKDIAFRIYLFKKLFIAYNKSCIYSNVIIDTTKLQVEFLRNFYIDDKVETAQILCLDNQFGVLQHIIISDDKPNQVYIKPKILCHAIVRTNARHVILSHNHPSGDTNPSSYDIIATMQLHRLIALFDTKLVDHYIFGPDDYCSMKSHNLLLEEPINGNSYWPTAPS